MTASRPDLLREGLSADGQYGTIGHRPFPLEEGPRVPMGNDTDHIPMGFANCPPCHPIVDPYVSIGRGVVLRLGVNMKPISANLPHIETCPGGRS